MVIYLFYDDDDIHFNLFMKEYLIKYISLKTISCFDYV